VPVELPEPSASLPTLVTPVVAPPAPPIAVYYRPSPYLDWVLYDTFTDEDAAYDAQLALRAKGYATYAR
jgi:hypothetical protein